MAIMDLSVTEQKHNLRCLNKEIRKALDIKSLSVSIIDRVFNTDEFKNAKSVFCYISFGHELDTSRILNYPDKNIFVPKIIGNEMLMTEYTPNDLEKSRFGILEPVNCSPVYPSIDDVIIVPALACDKNFYRIGYGGGFYDKFMKNSDALKILPVPSVFVKDDVPHDENDIRVDMIVTENFVLKSNKIVTKTLF